MARTVEEIHQEIIDAKDAQPSLSTLNSTSKVSIWYVFTYIVAVAFWTVEKGFDELKATISAMISAGKPHTLRWYVSKAKAFQHGRALVADEDYYDNAEVTDAQVLAEQVVKYAAAVNVPKGVKLKVSTIIDGDLAPLPTVQYNAFQVYMNTVKDAGVRLFFQNDNPDSLKLSVQIYYDPLVFNSDGERLDGTDNEPVQTAIYAFLKTQVVYNGLFVLAYLVDYLQKVPGVIIPHIVSAEAQYGLLPYAPFAVEYQPDAGYLRIIDPSDLTIEFIPHEII